METGYVDALEKVKGLRNKGRIRKGDKRSSSILDEIRSDQRDEAAAFACADYRYY